MKKLALIAAVMVLLVVMVFGQSQDQQQAQSQPQTQGQPQVQPQNPETTPYTNDSVARLSFVDGKAFLQRAADLGYENAELNMPITEGDRLSAADGRVEVSLGRGNYLRLDQNTKVDFLNLPKKGYDRIRLRVWAGNVYLDVNGLDKEKDIEVHTGDVSVYVLETGDYRINVSENEGTEVMVFDGLVEAAGEDGSNMINAGQMAELSGGRFTTRPTRIAAAAVDDFAKWNDSRDALVRRTVTDRHLPPELGDYEGELDQYGTWSTLAPYGWVWTPRGLGLGWHPYYYGRWSWLPMCGWTWIPYDAWGWAPFHYGRWGWDVGLGWYWIPTSIWGPAWCDFWWYGDYFGWAPLGWYGYPLVFVNGRCYDRWDRDYPHDSRCLTVIHKNQLSSHDITKAALTPDALKGVGKITLTSDRALAPRPISGAGLTQEKIGENQIMLKSTGRELGTREIRMPTDKTTATVDRGKLTGTTGTRKVVERTTTTGKTSTGSTSSTGTVRKIRHEADSSFSPSSEAGMGASAGQSASIANGALSREGRDIVGYPSRTDAGTGYYGVRSLRYSSPMDRFYNGFGYGSYFHSTSKYGSSSNGYYGSSGSYYHGSSSSKGSYSHGSSSHSSSSHGSSSSHSSSGHSSSSSHSSGGSHGSHH